MFENYEYKKIFFDKFPTYFFCKINETFQFHFERRIFMKKRIGTVLIAVILLFTMLIPVTVQAKTPEAFASLKSHIQVYGAINMNYKYSNNVYTSKISYQKKNKRFVFQCNYTNGNSTSSIAMYVPATKKKASYKVAFAQVIRASGKTAKGHFAKSV